MTRRQQKKINNEIIKEYESSINYHKRKGMSIEKYYKMIFEYIENNRVVRSK